MAELVKELKVKTGTYQKNGEQKNRWVKIGAMYKNDNGYFIRLNSIPISAEWDGLVSLFDPWKEDNQRKPADFQAPAKYDADFEDDLPF